MLSVKTKLTNNLNPKGCWFKYSKPSILFVFVYIHSFICYTVIFTRKTNSALLSNVICRNESNNSINDIIFILSSIEDCLELVCTDCFPFAPIGPFHWNVLSLSFLPFSFPPLHPKIENKNNKISLGRFQDWGAKNV